MDLIGKRIHELTVLERYRKNRRTYYKVKCSCGKKFKTRRDSVVAGKTKSCGHLTRFKSKDLIGGKFGRLKVVEKLGINKEGRQMWKCKCNCGNTTTVDTSSLLRGSTESCGCLVKELALKNKKHLDKWLKKDIRENTSLNNISRKNPIKSNKSGVTGVYFDKSRGKWLAQIEFQGKRHYLGRFDKKDDAVEARKKAEEKYFKPIIDKYRG